MTENEVTCTATKIMDKLCDTLGESISVLTLYAVLAYRMSDDQEAVDSLTENALSTVSILNRRCPSAPASRKGVNDGSSQSPT